MSIGLDFILRAKTSAFNQGLASANNAVKDLKKSVREFDVGGGFKQALGVGGVIAGFKLAISNAQDLRAEAEKVGKSVDDATASVARYGDALDELFKGTKNLTTQTVGFFTQAGEGWGMLINRLRGVSAEQEKIADGAARGAEEQEKALLAKKQAYAERAKSIDKAIADEQQKNAEAGLTNEEKRNRLLEERSKLLAEIDALPDKEGAGGVAKKEKILRATQLTGQISSLGESIYKDAEGKRQEQTKKEEAARKSLVEKFAPSVEQLAGQDTGGFFDANDPRIKARQILQNEENARTLFSRGDYKGGLALAQKAQGMRSALENQTSETGALTPKAAEQAFSDALKDTNTRLDELNKIVSGKFKAEK